MGRSHILFEVSNFIYTTGYFQPWHEFVTWTRRMSADDCSWSSRPGGIRRLDDCLIEDIWEKPNFLGYYQLDWTWLPVTIYKKQNEALGHSLWLSRAVWNRIRAVTPIDARVWQKHAGGPTLGLHHPNLSKIIWNNHPLSNHHGTNLWHRFGGHRLMIAPGLQDQEESDDWMIVWLEGE